MTSSSPSLTWWDPKAMSFGARGFAMQAVHLDLKRGYSIVGEHPTWSLRAMTAIVAEMKRRQT